MVNSAYSCAFLSRIFSHGLKPVTIGLKGLQLRFYKCDYRLGPMTSFLETRLQGKIQLHLLKVAIRDSYSHILKTQLQPPFFSWPNGKCLEVNEKINMKKLSGNRTLYKYVCEFVCVFSEFGFTNLKIMTSMAKNCIVKIRNWKRKSKHEGLHLLVNSYVELYLVEIWKQLCGP